MFKNLFKSNKISFSKYTLAIVTLIFIAYTYSLSGLISRLMGLGFESMTQVYIRVSIGFLLSLIFFHKDVKFRRIKKITKNDWLWLFIMGIVGYAASVWLGTLANLNTKLVNASAITSALPLVVYIYSYFLLKEKIKPKLILLLLTAAYGVTVIAGKSLQPKLAEFGLGEIYAILVVITGAWWSVGRRKLSDHLNNKEITMITMAIAAISGIFIALFRGEILAISAFTIPQVILGTIIGTVVNFTSTFAENFAYKNVDIVIANQILRITVVFTLINGVLFYREYITWTELFGAVIIIGSVWGAANIASSNQCES